jgi:hypothetical protein
VVSSATAITDHRERLRAAYDVHALFDSLSTAEDEGFDRAAWLRDATPVEVASGNEDA